MIVTIESTVAKTGWSMKKCANFMRQSQALQMIAASPQQCQSHAAADGWVADEVPCAGRVVGWAGASLGAAGRCCCGCCCFCCCESASAWSVVRGSACVVGEPCPVIGPVSPGIGVRCGVTTAP